MRLCSEIIGATIPKTSCQHEYNGYNSVARDLLHNKTALHDW